MASSLQIGLPGKEGRVIEAVWSQVTMTELCTVIGDSSEGSVATIEHLMAALSGLGVDNVLVEWMVRKCRSWTDRLPVSWRPSTKPGLSSFSPPVAMSKSLNRSESIWAADFPSFALPLPVFVLM